MRALICLTLFTGCVDVIQGTSDPTSDTSGPTNGTEATGTATDTGAPSTGAPTTSTASAPTTGELTTGEPSTGAPSTGAPSTGAPTTDDTSGSTGASGLRIEIEGGMAFDSNCQTADLTCGAKAICEAVTGGPCESQNYDCLSGGAGLSFFPQGGKGGDDLNFGAYDPSAPEYGNICACDAGHFAELGIPLLYPPCAQGAWRFVL